MLKKEGRNGLQQQCWSLSVPDENCEPGLEIMIVATSIGINIGDGVIPWEDLEGAKSVFYPVNVKEK